MFLKKKIKMFSYFNIFKGKQGEGLRLVLSRYYQDDKVTLGLLKIKGIDHKPIYTLERPWENNERSASCVPANSYKCAPFNGNKYKDVYEVLNVPKRTAILFHHGNYAEDTRGCILVGEGANYSNARPMITNSVSCLNELRSIIGDRKFSLDIREYF